MWFGFLVSEPDPCKRGFFVAMSHVEDFRLKFPNELSDTSSFDMRRETKEVELRQPIITMKFGGTSVGSAERIETVADIVVNSRDNGNAVVVVVSAMSGVTNLLVDLSSVEMVPEERGKTLRSIIDKHTTAVTELRIHPTLKHSLSIQLNSLFRELRGDVENERLAGFERKDRILSYGERMSSRLVAATLLGKGIRAHAIDSTGIIATDDSFGEAIPDIEKTRAKALLFLPLINDGVVPVITGFLGATNDGKITTLGRGGSDFSASIIGEALKSKEVWIWTDVDGVYDKDPRYNPDARIYEELSFEEADTMAKAGAKVLHQKTLDPLFGTNIVLRVKNSFNPEFPGTTVLPSLKK